jgi:hypothetical protein
MIVPWSHVVEDHELWLACGGDPALYVYQLRRRGMLTPTWMTPIELPTPPATPPYGRGSIL